LCLGSNVSETKIEMSEFIKGIYDGTERLRENPKRHPNDPLTTLRRAKASAVQIPNKKA